MKKILYLLSISIISSTALVEEVSKADIENSYFKYEVVRGDTLWSIAREFDVKISDLVKANKVSRHSSGLPLILIGEIIFIPTYLDYQNPENYCFNEYSWYGYNFTKIPRSKIISNCIDKLSQKYSLNFFNKENRKKEFWTEYLINKELPYFVYNYLTQLYDQEDKIELIRNFEEILIEGVFRGDIVNRKHVLDFSKHYSEKYPELAENQSEFIDKSLSSLSQIDKGLFISLDNHLMQFYDKQRSINFYQKYLDADLSIFSEYEKAVYFKVMWEGVKSSKDNSLFNFERKIVDYLNLIDTSLISDTQFNLYVNLMYHFLNIGKPQRAVNLSNRLLSTHNLDSPTDLWNSFVSNMEYEYEKYFVDPVLIYILNDHSAVSGTLGKDKQSYLKERDYLLGMVDQASERGDLTPFTDAAWKSDTGLEMIDFQDCLSAEEYLIKAFSIYRDNEDEFSDSSDAFNESIILSGCFLKQKNFIKATQYLELSKEFYEKSNRSDSMYTILESLFNSMLSLKKGFVDTALIEIQTNNKKLIESEYLLGISWYRLLDEYIINYSQIFNEYRDYKLTNSLTHPLELIYIKERIKNNENFSSIETKNKTNDSNWFTARRSERINKDFEENEEKIKQTEYLLTSSPEQVDLEFLRDLYLTKANLITKIYDDKKNLKELLNPDYKIINQLRSELENDEVILTYHISSDSFAWVITSKEEFFIDIQQNKDSIARDIRELNKSLEIKDGSVPEFNFELANKLYKNLFEEVHERIGSEKTIYLLGSNLDRLQFNVLVTMKTDKRNYYQNLLESKFLIDEFNFVRIFPLNKSKKTKFNQKFVGFANPSSIQEVGLPALPSAEEESIYLAMASGVNTNNYFGEDASKEKVIELLENSFERIHFGTHALPPYWNGISPDTSLLLSSEKGDFLLTSSEISSLDIKSDVVILASCNSSTDGFDSLYKSFLVAGSNSVIYTNWDLETNSGKFVTEELFKIMWLQEDLPLHEALRQAVLKVKGNLEKSEFISPSFWANFSISYSSI